MHGRPQVVIVGGGFGGLHAARGLRKAPVEVTLVDRRNFHLFQPLLYQVATGALSPANIAAPLRNVLSRQKNVRVLLGEAYDIDVANRRLILRDGSLLYDTLILATGARHHYFGQTEWEKVAPGLKTIEEALDIRARVLTAFEHAERETDPERIRSHLTFVVIGAGPTGVELAGALGEMARNTLVRDFRNINTRSARIMLLEGGPRVLPTFHEKLSARATRSLEHLGVTMRCNTKVVDVQPGAVTMEVGGARETIRAETVLWGAGVQASPLGAVLARAAGATLDRAGRVLVQPDLTVPGHPEIFVLGDMASFSHQTGQPLPGVAPVAMQQGDYVARLIRDRLEGKPTLPFRYHDRGSMATIGRAHAVADLGWVRFGGFLAWLAWLFIHLLYLVGFQNRVLVMFQWAWSYFSRGRSSRLITGGRE
jgi:NADH dehydrogenase